MLQYRQRKATQTSQNQPKQAKHNQGVLKPSVEGKTDLPTPTGLWTHFKGQPRKTRASHRPLVHCTLSHERIGNEERTRVAGHTLTHNSLSTHIALLPAAHTAASELATTPGAMAYGIAEGNLTPTRAIIHRDEFVPVAASINEGFSTRRERQPKQAKTNPNKPNTTKGC